MACVRGRPMISDVMTTAVMFPAIKAKVRQTNWVFVNILFPGFNKSRNMYVTYV